MTNTEQKLLTRGLAAGLVVGLALGGIIALFIAMRPGILAALVG